MRFVATVRRRTLAALSYGALIDIALASALFIGTLVLLLRSGVDGTPPGSMRLSLLSIVLAALSTLPLSIWRRSPVGVFAITATASVALVGIGYLIELPLGLSTALYLLTANGERETPWRWHKTMVVGGALITYLCAEAIGQQSFPAIVEFHTALVWAVAWFAGERTRLRSEHIAQLKERALTAEREAERERQFAAATERARIARDLHDSAGHSISVIAVRAGAARLRHAQDPDRSLRALEAIEEQARQTVDEIDQMIGALRDGSSANTGLIDAPPGVASLPTLIAQRSAAGLKVKFDVSGRQRLLGVAVDQAVYRIVQEALTNATRHGQGDARIELAFGETAIELAVTNPMSGNGKSLRERHGLVGMRERATLLGGRFDTDCANGTFRVRARIPYGDGHI